MTTIDFDLEVSCEVCGKDLCVTTTKTRNDTIYITVDPCDKCMKDAKEEGVEEEAKRNEEV